MKEILVAIKMNVLFVVFTGIIFPVVVWGISQAFLPFQANGSLLRRTDGTVIGSALLGQQFTQARYFHGRPSVAGAGYDASNSGGTNLGPTSAKLFNGIQDDRATAIDETFPGVADLARAYRAENSLQENATIPVDAVTRSASGLDPDISPANALLQMQRVATARRIPVSMVEASVNRLTQYRYLGIFGEPRVNVLALNLLLDSQAK